MPENNESKSFVSFNERISLVTVGTCGFLAPISSEGIDEDERREWND